MFIQAFMRAVNELDLHDGLWKMFHESLAFCPQRYLLRWIDVKQDRKMSVERRAVFLILLAMSFSKLGTGF